jgi:hypothetical protein
VTRYGNQPLSEVLTLSTRDLEAYHAALNRLIGRENEPAPEKS